MIRLPIKQTALKAQIRALVPDWFNRADERLARATAAGKVADGDGIWSEIKTIYMEHQGFKCMYCEKPMPKPAPGGVAGGKVEFDVEHFRPKNRVTRWPTPAVKTKRGIDYDHLLLEGVAAGYLRLAFDPWNYGVSCKTCNSELKSDRFPIVGVSNATLKARRSLDTRELPCLILPIGDEGEDPEKWLEWKGPTVAPRSTLDTKTSLRAKTLVDFFELDTRGDLLLLRCAVVMLLFNDLNANGPGTQFVKALTDPKRTFAACARAYVKLFQTNKPEAQRWNDLAQDYLARQDPAIFA
jgi:hypothetical protein